MTLDMINRGVAMRYGVALAIAALLVVGLELYVWREAQAIERLMQQRIQAGQAAGEIPADPEKPNLKDVNSEVSQSEMFRIMLVDAFCRFRIILLPIIFLAGLGIAHLLK